MNKRFLFSILSVSLFFSQASFAGWKEVGGDDSLVFKCQSQSSSVKLFGYESVYEGLIELIVVKDGQVIGDDMGMLENQKFDGERLELSFGETETTATALVKRFAKVAVEKYTCEFR